MAQLTRASRLAGVPHRLGMASALIAGAVRTSMSSRNMSALLSVKQRGLGCMAATRIQRWPHPDRCSCMSGACWKHRAWRGLNTNSSDIGTTQQQRPEGLDTNTDAKAVPPLDDSEFLETAEVDADSCGELNDFPIDEFDDGPEETSSDQAYLELARESVVDSFSMEDLINARVHYGHHQAVWNSKMEPFLYGVREDIHIFDLEQTAVMLRRALLFLRGIAQRGGIVLFVGGTPKTAPLVRTVAKNCGEYFVDRRWLPGALTNRLHLLRADVLPDVVVVLNVEANGVALRETYLLNIPSVGIVDSDQDPFAVTYAIPGNDDSLSALQLYCDLMGRAVLEGKQPAARRMYS